MAHGEAMAERNPPHAVPRAPADLRYLRDHGVALLLDNLIEDLLKARPAKSDLRAFLRNWIPRCAVEQLAPGANGQQHSDDASRSPTGSVDSQSSGSPEAPTPGLDAARWTPQETNGALQMEGAEQHRQAHGSKRLQLERQVLGCRLLDKDYPDRYAQRLVTQLQNVGSAAYHQPCDEADGARRDAESRHQPERSEDRSLGACISLMEHISKVYLKEEKLEVSLPVVLMKLLQAYIAIDDGFRVRPNMSVTVQPALVTDDHTVATVKVSNAGQEAVLLHLSVGGALHNKKKRGQNKHDIARHPHAHAGELFIKPGEEEAEKMIMRPGPRQKDVETLVLVSNP